VVPGTGYRIKYISAQGFLGKGLAAKILFPFWMAVGTIQSLFQMLRSRPDEVLGTGGYVSAPPVMAAWLLRIPVALLALDVMPSQAVRFLSRFANQIYGGFPECAGFLDKRPRVIFTGNPIRPDIGMISKGQGLAAFGLDENKKTVLIFGGSQGAHSINVSVLDALKHLGRSGYLKDIQMIFQTGKRDHGLVAEEVKRFAAKIKVLAYIDEMPQALAAADLVVSRSGAGVSETLACGLPSILIPYPHAASNHQEYNARSLEQAGAAMMILDKDVNGKILADSITGILFNRERYNMMTIASRSLARPGAADKIADNIIRMAGK